RPAENAHRDLDPRASIINLLNRSVERGERSVGDAHLLADLERHRRFRPLDALLHLMQDSLCLGVGDRERLVVGAEKAGHLRGVLDQVVGLVKEVHLHQYITREEFSLGVNLAAAPHFNDLLFGHHDLLEQVIEMPLLGLLANRVCDLVLEVRVGLHDIPALAHSRLIRSLVHPPPPKLSAKVTTIRMTWSASTKNTAATAFITKTIMVVPAVSRRDGQVTFCPSARTSCRNLKGLTFAMRFACQTAIYARRTDQQPTQRQRAS